MNYKKTKHLQTVGIVRDKNEPLPFTFLSVKLVFSLKIHEIQTLSYVHDILCLKENKPCEEWVMFSDVISCPTDDTAAILNRLVISGVQSS